MTLNNISILLVVPAEANNRELPGFLLRLLKHPVTSLATNVAFFLPDFKLKIR